MTEREIRGTLRRHGERSLYLFALTSRLATGERIYRFEIREGYCDEMDASRRLYFFDRAKLANRIEQSGISFFSQRICPVLLLGQREREREGSRVSTASSRWKAVREKPTHLFVASR